MKLINYVETDFIQLLRREISSLEEMRKENAFADIALETIIILEKCLDDLLEEREDKCW